MELIKRSAVGVAGLRAEYFSPDWKALGASGRRVFPVIWANDKLAEPMKWREPVPRLADSAGIGLDTDYEHEFNPQFS